MLKIKTLTWSAGEPVHYGGAVVETTYRCETRLGGHGFNICESEGKFYPLWTAEPPEGFDSLSAAQELAQSTFEEYVTREFLES